MILIYLYSFNNFELNNPFVSVKLIVWALFAGFVIASLMAVYNKRVIGTFVKDIIAQGCLSEKDAKTIIDLGYGTDWFIKNALRTDTVLRRFVVRIDGNSGNKEPETPASAGNATAEESGRSGSKKSKTRKSTREIIDFSTARFYIPEDLKYRAEIRYASRGTDVVSFFICVVILAVAAFAAIFIIPELMQLIDNFIGTL